MISTATLSCPRSLRVSVPSPLTQSLKESTAALASAQCLASTSSELHSLLTFFIAHCFFRARKRGVSDGHRYHVIITPAHGILLFPTSSLPLVPKWIIVCSFV